MSRAALNEAHSRENRVRYRRCVCGCLDLQHGIWLERLDGCHGGRWDPRCLGHHCSCTGFTLAASITHEGREEVWSG